MSSVKDSLRNTIELLNEEEARQTLEFVQRLKKEGSASLTMRQLATDPTFKIPSGGCGSFSVVEPIQGKGVAASILLVEDRR